MTSTMMLARVAAKGSSGVLGVSERSSASEGLVRQDAQRSLSVQARATCVT